MGVLWDKVIDYIVSNLWFSLAFWRTTAIILVVFISLAFTLRNKVIKILQKETIKAIDRAKFTESDLIMNERQLNEFIEKLGTNRYYHGQSRVA